MTIQRWVLIVDDQPESQEILRNCIEKIPGWKVSGTAKNGWEARVELSKRRPDVIFLDEVLPGESSQDLVQEWEMLEIPIFLMTGLLEKERILEAKPVLGRFEKPTWRSVDTDRDYLESLLNQVFPPETFS